MHPVLGLNRHRTFEPDDLELLSNLVPDLHIALRVQEHLGALRARAERAERALDSIPVAVLLLDVHGTIVHANQPAADLLQRSDGLCDVDGHLCCGRAEETARLQSAVDKVAQGLLRGEIPACTTLAVSRPDRVHPLGVLIAPLLTARTGGTTADGLHGVAHILVTVRDPDATQRLPVDVLQQQFDLTPAQARLAAALAAGDSLEDYARHAGVTVNTARTTLKSVFARTGCRRQAELVLMLTGSVAALSMPTMAASAPAQPASADLHAS